jgi:NADH:ubiquinone oxidoreductase subunit 2 (subunit N)
LYVFASAFSVEESHAFHGPLIALAIIGVINSAIAAAYYLRIMASAYMGGEAEASVPSGGPPVRWGLALCTIPLLVLFAWPGGLTRQTGRATAVLNQAIEVPAARVTSTTVPVGGERLPEGHVPASASMNTDMD